jgi:hypothetical protein
MKLTAKSGLKYALGLALIAGLGCAAAEAQDPIVVSTAAAIAIKTITPKKDPHPKFEGTVMNSNSILITVRGKENELAVRTFTLSEEAAVKMQKIIDKGGYQYGDKVTVYYDPNTEKAVKIKGKASKPI